MSGPIDINAIRDFLPHRYPFLLVDRVLSMKRKKRIEAIKCVTAKQPFFQGHFPGLPVMPGVLIIEALAQAAGVLIMHEIEDRESKLMMFTGIDGCRFRRPVVPGDVLFLDVQVLNLRSNAAKLRAVARVEEDIAAEATLMSVLTDRESVTWSLFADAIDPRSIVYPGARLGDGCSVGPFSTIGPRVTLGSGTRVASHVVIDGDVQMGENNTIYPFCVIGLPPQDLKYAGEPADVIIGDRNVFREYSQVHRGTVGGGGVTRIGHDGYFMVSSHVAHDCVIGDHVLFANAATLAGHVEVHDHATIGAYSGVHQFCRVGRHAFIGGYSVVTRDALPYCLTVGDRATCYGPNRVGLLRKGFSKQNVQALDAAARTIFRTTTTREEALKEVESDPQASDEVREMLSFIRESKRGVIPIRLGAAG